jgi:hypothetical protein
MTLPIATSSVVRQCASAGQDDPKAPRARNDSSVDERSGALGQPLAWLGGDGGQEGGGVSDERTNMQLTVTTFVSVDGVY